MSEHEIERFLDRACCGVGGSPELRRHLRQELQEHLTEEIERNVAAGMTEEQAVQKTLEDFGDPAVIRDGLQTVHGRRLLALLIEKSMRWRERTMKTDWKWNFVAQVGLVLIIAAEVFLVGAVMTYILPSLRAWHENVGTPMFAYLEPMTQCLGWLLYDQYWLAWFCLALALIGVIVFERKYRRENKATVRLTGLSLAALAMFLVLASICVPLTIDLAILPRQIYNRHVDLTPHQAERIVLPRIIEAEAAFEELCSAIDREDWPAVGHSAERLSDAYRALENIGNATLVLAGENQRDNLSDIHDLIDAIKDSGRDIHHRFATYEHTNAKVRNAAVLKERLQPYLTQLQESYAELTAKSDLFACRDQAETLN